MEVENCHTEMMWSDILNKKKQFKYFRIIRSELLNFPVDYDNELEQSNTHPDLLAAKDRIKSSS